MVFNDPVGLESTIKSVVAQDFDGYEYLVIDGGSDKPTLDVIKRYSDKIDVVVSEPDSGIYDAMNKGINLAKCQWIQFLNAGDRYANESVLKLVLR